MKNLARIRWVLFAVASGCGAAGTLLAACGSDDTLPHPPYDASVDGGKDTGPGGDSGKDSGKDSGQDSGPDTGPVDGGPDARTNFDAGFPQLETYVDQITRMYCLKASQCCGESTFDVDKCVQTYKSGPGPGALLNLPAAPFLDGGHMQIDPVAAAKCYDDINALSCGATAGSLRKTYDDCVAGALGTIPADQTGCKGSPECATPNHCELADGGLPNGTELGTCRPPRATGANCDLGQYDEEGYIRPNAPNLFYEPQAQCGYLMTGKPGYCANYDTNVGWETKTKTCKPVVQMNEADTRCYVHVECSTSYCEGVIVDQDADTIIPGHCSNDPLVGADNFCKEHQKDAGADAAFAPSARGLAPNVETSPTLHKVRH